jgi:hypothetical protein
MGWVEVLEVFLEGEDVVVLLEVEDSVVMVAWWLVSPSGLMALGGLARYCVHTTATWDQFWNIIKKVRNHLDGVFLVSP